MIEITSPGDGISPYRYVAMGELHAVPGERNHIKGFGDGVRWRSVILARLVMFL